MELNNEKQHEYFLTVRHLRWIITLLLLLRVIPLLLVRITAVLLSLRRHTLPVAHVVSHLLISTWYRYVHTGLLRVHRVLRHADHGIHLHGTWNGLRFARFPLTFTTTFTQCNRTLIDRRRGVGFKVWILLREKLYKYFMSKIGFRLINVK